MRVCVSERERERVCGVCVVWSGIISVDTCLGLEGGGEECTCVYMSVCLTLFTSSSSSISRWFFSSSLMSSLRWEGRG